VSGRGWRWQLANDDTEDWSSVENGGNLKERKTGVSEGYPGAACAQRVQRGQSGHTSDVSHARPLSYKHLRSLPVLNSTLCTGVGRQRLSPTGTLPLTFLRIMYVLLILFSRGACSCLNSVPSFTHLHIRFPRIASPYRTLWECETRPPCGDERQPSLQLAPRRTYGRRW
jgi:hypothetical protein